MPNPYPWQFVDLLDQTNGPVLDCGSGDRHDSRVISLDYDACPGVDVRADGAALPFPDDTFTLILSQAVLEHVTEPQAHVDELVRVLAPEGVVIIQVAFMQPIHLAPRHYFGITGYGLLHLCAALDVLDIDGMGSLAESWDWVGRESGAHNILTPREFAGVRTAMAKVDRWMDSAQLWRVAPGIHLVGRKP